MKVTDRRSVPEARTHPDRLAFKTAEGTSGQLLAIEDAEGIVTAIVSVTGTEDEVSDIIVPGAYAETLVKRRPKVCWAHSWEHPIGRVLHIEELMPGDDRLPTMTKDGQPWDRNAGALVATMQFNMRTREGKDAFEAVRFYSETGECEYSIGYNVPPGKSTKDRAGVRHIKSLDLYELSVVLFGAHTMTGTISIKAALEAAIERKTARNTGVVAKAVPQPRSAKDALAAVRAGNVIKIEGGTLNVKSGTVNLTGEIKAKAPPFTAADAPAAAPAPPAPPAAPAPETPAVGEQDPQSLKSKWDDGVMVALYPDPAAADIIAKHIAGPDETTEREELHVTLAFLGKADEISMNADEVFKRVSEAVEGEASLSGIVGGIGLFPDNGDGAPTWVPVDVPGVNLLHEQIVEALGDVVKTDHGFTPHMTIGYDLGQIDPIPETPVTFSEVRIVYGTATRSVPLAAPLADSLDEVEEKSIADLPLSEAARLTALETLFQMGPVEIKAGGADRNRGGAEDLRKYWLPGGKGGAEIGWNTPGDFTRCVALVGEHMTPENAKGYCFTGETKVITRDGVATLADLAGTDPVILTHDAPTSPHASPVRRDGRWVQAPVRSYGEQRVLRVTLRRGQDRKVIGATPEHEWFASTDARSEARKRARRLTTADLRPGMALTALMPGAGGAVRSLPSPFGVAAGVVFGDGHVQPGRGALVDLWDEKDAYLLRYFEGTRQEQRKTAGGVLGVRVSGLPASWKAAPSLDEGTSYLYGWLAGYIAADGTVGERGNVTLSSANSDHLRHAAAVAHRLGIATHPIKGHDRLGLGTVPTTLYRMTFVGTTVPADLLVLPEHKRRFEAATRRHEAVRWVVESVEDHGEREEVFCADVPGTHTFALADYLWVANCANRHKEATGMWPGDSGNKGLADGYDPSMETKTPLPEGGKGYPRLPGSMEERQDALAASLTESMRGEELDGDHGDRWEWPGVSIDATFEDHVIVSRYKWDGTDDRETYDIPYAFTPNGVVLGDLEPVELQVVALGVNGDDVDNVALGDIIPFADDIEQVARAFKAAHHSSIQTKAGRVLSGANERKLRSAMENLVNVLAAAGVRISVDEPEDEETPASEKPKSKPDERKPVDPAVDMTTTSQSASTKSLDGDVVILDADAVKATLAALSE